MQDNGGPTPVRVGKKDYLDCGVDTRDRQPAGRSPKQDQKQLLRQDAAPRPIQGNNQTLWKDTGGPVCDRGHSTGSPLRQLQGGGDSLVHRRLLQTPSQGAGNVRKPTIRLDRQTPSQDKKGESRSDTGGTCVDVPTLVAGSQRHDAGAPTEPSKEGGNVPVAKELPATQAPESKLENDRLQSIRRSLIDKGFTKQVYEMMLAKFKTPSANKGTLRSYQNVWQSFGAFCSRQGKRKDDLNTQDVANFIAERYQKGDSGFKIDAVITAGSDKKILDRI